MTADEAAALLGPDACAAADQIAAAAPEFDDALRAELAVLLRPARARDEQSHADVA